MSQKLAMWRYKNEILSISFLGVFFPTSLLISLIKYIIALVCRSSLKKQTYFILISKKESISYSLFLLLFVMTTQHLLFCPFVHPFYIFANNGCFHLCFLEYIFLSLLMNWKHGYSLSYVEKGWLWLLETAMSCA